MLIERILIINLGGIGDILLSQPALRAIRSKYADARISFLAVPRAYDLLKSMPYIDEIFIFDINPGIKGIWKDLLVLSQLRRRKFDLAVNMRTIVSSIAALKMRFLLGIINPKVSAGRNTDGRGGFFDIKVCETVLGEKHELEYDIDTANSLGAEVADRKICVSEDETALKKIKNLLFNKGITEADRIISIYVGGKQSRSWPVRNFFDVIGIIDKKIKSKYLIAGEARDYRIVEGLIPEVSADIISLTGCLSLSELIALIKISGLFICNDTGPMHIAAVLGIPLVAIFGPGNLVRYDPRKISDKAAVLYKKADCAPCNRTVCDSIKCLKSILPGDVAAEALALMDKYKEAKRVC